MTSRSTQHASVAIERSFAATPARVFEAWADPAAKARWFIGPPGKWTVQQRGLDFRVGGSERLSGTLADGKVTRFDAIYRDIVKDRRLVYVYDMCLAGRQRGTNDHFNRLEAELGRQEVGV